jgi:hypothetical protein
MRGPSHACPSAWITEGSSGMRYGNVGVAFGTLA